MFTGIIQHAGLVDRATTTAGGRRLCVDVGPLAERLAVGDSVAINGVCLTVAAVDGTLVGFDAVDETLNRTNLGRLVRGSKVNLEVALRIGDGLDGHLVQGHVDGWARVDRIDRSGGQYIVYFTSKKELTDEMVPKGSVALDGISLTLIDVADGRFHVTVIPTTLAATTWSDLGAGDRVNVETDILGKYVRRLLAQSRDGEGVTIETLRQAGFV